MQTNTHEQDRRLAELAKRNYGLQLALTELCSQLEAATIGLTEEQRQRLAASVDAESSYRGTLERLVRNPAGFAKEARKLRKLVRDPVAFLRDSQLYKRVRSSGASQPEDASSPFQRGRNS